MNKKLTAMLITIMLLFSTCGAMAAEVIEEYTGEGVALRGFPKGMDASAYADDLINVGYVRCNSPYCIIGESANWEIGVDGGTAPYDIDIWLFRQELDATDNLYWGTKHFDIDDNRSFDFTLEKEGRYFWKITITDSLGQYLVFKSRPFESATEADESDSMTVAGKVNQIISETITDGMSEYARALALHDWLIYNANYDYTFTHYDASGVLLYGTGVCDSYARAYMMLCAAAGIECIYVAGFGNGGAHGWNLVKIDGQWYHVDCTWDDPGEGGYERHTYFMLSDEEMAVDHEWNINNGNDMLVPDTEDSEDEPSTPDFDLTLTQVRDNVQLSWNLIPGATEYQVCKRLDGVETILTTVGDTNATISRSMFADGVNDVYVVARRVVQGECVLSYTSEMLQYGSPNLSYQCYLPSALGKIEDAAFQNSDVGNVYIPSGVKSIGASAFAGCASMKAIRIPVGVTFIGSGAFTDSGLQYAVVIEDSYAHSYMKSNYPNVTIIFE